MTQADASPQSSTGGEIDAAGGDLDAPDPLAWLKWARNHRVLLAAIALVVIHVTWRAQFLAGMFFRQDDFHVLDMAIEKSFSWRYLTFNGAGHLIIGPRAVAWPLARTSLYNWRLDSGLIVALVAMADLAAVRLFRTLFGDRPAIILPLAVYLLSPLMVPVLGEWSAALEYVPLQLCIFMAMNAHVYYVRTGRARHLVAAAVWVALGMIFFEKGLVLPPLLFAVTSGFLVRSPSWISGIRMVASKFRRAWATYAVLMTIYIALVAYSLKTSHVQPSAPTSVQAMAKFSWTLIWNTFLPGAIGGPWRWWPPGQSYALAAPPTALAFIAGVTVVVVLSASIWFGMSAARRSWVILVGWLLVADMVPVFIGRLNYLGPRVLGMDTRYLADAVPVLAICVGLAFWPVLTHQEERPQPLGHWSVGASNQIWRNIAAFVVGMYIVGAIWSVQAYQSTVTGRIASEYIANAAQAIRLVRSGTPIADSPVPLQFDSGLFGGFQMASRVVGDMTRLKPGLKLNWTSPPRGTIDNLMIFGNDGRLHPAEVAGASSLHLAANNGCWPERHGAIHVKFATAPSAFTNELRIGYLWGSASPGTVSVRYGEVVQNLSVERGLHAGYLAVMGSARGVTISGLAGRHLCVGDVEAGFLEAGLGGPVIPKKSA